MSDRLWADYWLETPDDPHRAAAVIAGEQSSGTFLTLAAETPELKARAGARVEALEVLGQSRHPSLPVLKTSAAYTQCHLTLSWPLENMGTCLPTIMATVAGNLYELGQVSGLRLLRLRLPRALGQVYPGPAFGMAGTRALSGVACGPLIGTIIKPSVGLNPQQTAEQVQMLVDGGIDFIKDDELQADGPHCPFELRVRAVMDVVQRHADKTGNKPMVAFNITGELEAMRRRHDWVQQHGGTCVMVVLNAVGLVGVRALREHSQLPIHGHRAGWGYLARSPALGWDFAAWQPFWRLAGVDHLHVNGLRNKFSDPDEVVIAAARSVIEPLWPDQPLTAVPVYSSAQTGLQAQDTFNAQGNADLIVTAGGGIFGHPQGISAGVAALREAWEAAQAGVDLHVYAASRPALRAALDFWR